MRPLSHTSPFVVVIGFKTLAVGAPIFHFAPLIPKCHLHANFHFSRSRIAFASLAAPLKSDAAFFLRPNNCFSSHLPAACEVFVAGMFAPSGLAMCLQPSRTCSTVVLSLHPEIIISSGKAQPQFCSAPCLRLKKDSRNVCVRHR